MTIAIYIYIVGGNSPAPICAFLELFVIDVDASIDDIDIDALSTIRIILIPGESAESQPGTVADPSEALDRKR
jgi:hypothetical protein